MKNKATIYTNGFEIRRENVRIDAILKNDLWIIDFIAFTKENRDKDSFDVFIERMKGVLTVKRLIVSEAKFKDLISVLTEFYKNQH